jgi:PAS domain S-box-containing protein
MAKIAFIAPDKQLFLNANKLSQELGLADDISIYLARLNRAVRLAERLEREGTDVIISRGGTAKLIQDSNITTPVVELVITGQDLAQTLHQVRQETVNRHPNVFMIGFSNMIQDIESLAAILGIRVTILPISRVEDIATNVEQAVALGADIVIGGIRTVTLASMKGLKTYLIGSGSFSIRAAFSEAQKVALGRRIEKERLQQFKILVEAASEGIITVDRDHIIKVFNPTAEKLLARSAHEVVGRRLDSAFNAIKVEQCLVTGNEILGQVVNIGAGWINVNVSPIKVDQTITGCLITFQDITRVQEMETKIRNEVSARRFNARYRFSDIIGVSASINETKRIAQEIASVDATVLISGETGTGKELFAQSIHAASSRKNGPFVAVNCAALPQNLLESELFGYVEGAFTGATKKGKPGVFELAHLGTIFLDEISEMDTYAQIRLLRILQERQVMRLGDNKYIPVDVRVIAATNKNLGKLVAEDRFRQDFYYRLKVLTLHLPRLSDRPEDIEYLTQHFLKTFNRQYQKRIEFTPDALEWLKGYNWPGNVRELLHFVERIVVIAKDQKITQRLVIQYGGDDLAASDLPRQPVSHPSPEHEQITAALLKANYNISRAAEFLQLDRSTLYRKLKQYKIQINKTY